MQSYDLFNRKYPLAHAFNDYNRSPKLNHLRFTYVSSGFERIESLTKKRLDFIVPKHNRSLQLNKK
jgi:hypothetical protein